MKNLTSRLIRLGYTYPELRPNLRKVLDKISSMDFFDTFDVEDEEIPVTSRSRWESLTRGDHVKIGSVGFKIIKNEGIQKYATKLRTKGRKHYLLTPLTMDDDPVFAAYEIVGTQPLREPSVTGKIGFDKRSSLRQSSDNKVKSLIQEVAFNNRGSLEKLIAESGGSRAVKDLKKLHLLSFQNRNVLRAREKAFKSLSMDAAPDVIDAYVSGILKLKKSLVAASNLVEDFRSLSGGGDPRKVADKAEDLKTNIDKVMFDLKSSISKLSYVEKDAIKELDFIALRTSLGGRASRDMDLSTLIEARINLDALSSALKKIGAVGSAFPDLGTPKWEW